MSSTQIKKEVNQTKTAKLTKQLTDALYPQISTTAVTNFVKIPSISGLLPHGGVLKFRKNDNYNAWIKPYDLNRKKPIKIEIGDDLLRPQSFIQEPQQESASKEEDKPIGIERPYLTWLTRSSCLLIREP